MNSELLYITRKLGYPSSFGTRAGLGDFLEQYPDGVYAENGGGAPIGWESAAVWFGGDSERAAARFERMMSERNELSRVFRTRIAGVLLLTFIYRLKSRMVTAIPIGGSQPQPIDPTWLYFTMPQGGTVTLTKTGAPTAVTLEYSLDNGASWIEWIESGNVRTVTLAAGQTMHLRNTSATITGFSTSLSNYYQFAFTADTYAGGNTNSLLCKNPEIVTEASYCCYLSLFKDCVHLMLVDTFSLPSVTIKASAYREMFFGCTSLVLPRSFVLSATDITSYCYYRMFLGCKSLTVQDNFALPATNLFDYCYSQMFQNCTSLVLPETFVLPATTLADRCYSAMFSGCTLVDVIKTNMTDISASNCTTNWLVAVSPTGDFYCPAELTIPTGASGIPSGWTRHDI